MYFLAKDDRKTNFVNFDAWKYTPYFLFFSFFEIFREAFAPAPHGAPPPLAEKRHFFCLCDLSLSAQNDDCFIKEMF